MRKKLLEINFQQCFTGGTNHLFHAFIFFPFVESFFLNKLSLGNAKINLMQYKIHYFHYFNYSLKTTDFTLILTKSAWFSSLRDTPPLATPPSLCQLQTEARPVVR